MHVSCTSRRIRPYALLRLEKQNPMRCIGSLRDGRASAIKASFSSSQALCKSLTFLLMYQTVREKEQSVP